MTYLIKYHGNWADEMDVEGWVILTDDQKNEFMAATETEGAYPVEFWPGTNESITYNSREEFLRDITILPLSDVQIRVLHGLFDGEDIYGWVPNHLWFAESAAINSMNIAGNPLDEENQE